MADGGKGGGCVCVERERQDATSQPRSPPRKSVYTERKGKKHDARGRRERRGERERDAKTEKRRFRGRSRVGLVGLGSATEIPSQKVLIPGTEDENNDNETKKRLVGCVGKSRVGPRTNHGAPSREVKKDDDQRSGSSCLSGGRFIGGSR